MSPKIIFSLTFLVFLISSSYLINLVESQEITTSKTTTRSSPIEKPGQAIKPLLSLNNNYSQAQLEGLPDTGVFIKQALLFIFTGSYNGTVSNGTALDENNLDLMIDGGIQLLASVLDEQEDMSDEDKRS
jgi:hypothetical protein